MRRTADSRIGSVHCAALLLLPLPPLPLPLPLPLSAAAPLLRLRRRPRRFCDRYVEHASFVPAAVFVPVVKVVAQEAVEVVLRADSVFAQSSVVPPAPSTFVRHSIPLAAQPRHLAILTSR